MSRLPSLAFCLICAACAVAGCAPWDVPSVEPLKLPAAQMSPDSVALDITFVRMPAADAASNDAIWAEADEQHFPADVRRQLAANGLRVGVIGVQIPARLRELLDAKMNQFEERSDDVGTSDGEVNRSPRRQQCRAARPVKIPVSKTHASLAALVFEEGQLHGQQLSSANCLFVLKPYPQGDGHVRLDVTPEIEHGQTRQEWVGIEAGSLMQRTSRDRLVLDRLQFKSTLAPGQILLVSATPDVKGLGEQFFTETANGTVERTLLLVRLAQTQYDDLFAPDQIAAPLATPGE